VRPGALSILVLAGTALPALAADDARAKCFAGSVRACSAAVDAAPADVELRRRAAKVFLGERWDDDAVVNLMEVVRLRPNEAAAHADLAAALATLNRFTDAVAPVERALALGADDLATLQLAAIAFRAGKRWSDLVRADLRAAAKGDRLAMYELAELYENGMGVAADPAAAYGWLTRAAEAGHIGAMDRLAEVHRDGLLGRPKDAALAAAWQKKADEADGN
jgi:TPR repeat protein